MHVLAAKQAAALGHVQQAEVDDAMRRLAGDVVADEDDAAGRGPQQARNRPQECALAGTVAADQGHDVAFGDGEIDAAQHADMAVADFQANHLQQDRAGAHDAACPTLACDPM